MYVCVCIYTHNEHIYDLLRRIGLDDYGGWLSKSRYVEQATKKGRQ